ncbi:MAG: galactokinase [Minicystis sp.]
MAEQMSGPSFRDLFGRDPDVAASAPGRVNLIGEHTDYNDGWVLPAAIPQRTHVELARRGDDTALVWSANVGAEDDPQSYVLGAEAPGRGFLDYVQGVTRVLRDEGISVPGYNLRIASDVPVGAGLSSSAALEVALLRALREAFSLPLDDVQIAKLGRRTENEFVGAPVGIMDQMAASLANTESALFLDTRTLGYELVPIPSSIELVVIDSAVPHSHVAGEYRTRRAACEEASALLGVTALRDLGTRDLDRMSRILPDLLFRRARHVITENERVIAAVAALRSGDVGTLGQLFYASHASMRDDYEVSVPPVDLLVELARSEPDVAGARLTGGGFGGSVVILAKQGAGRGIAARVAAAYEARSGLTPRVLVPSA